jgi:lactoylglutathione lyase
LELTGAEARRSREEYLQNRIARLRRPPRHCRSQKYAAGKCFWAGKYQMGESSMKTAFLLLSSLTLATLAQGQDAGYGKVTFNHLALSVRDVDRSADFYARVLNLSEVHKDARAKGVRWLSLGNGQELHLISPEYYRGGVVKTNKAVHLALTSDRFEDFLALLNAAGVAYGNWSGEPKKIETRSDGAKQVFFQDPDGYWIEVNSVAQDAIGSNRTSSNLAAGDEAAVKQAVRGAYSVFYGDVDKVKYRSLLTDDYVLLENGELLDVEGDIALMPASGDDYQRTDAFDFRLVKIHGNTAYAVYFLKSEIMDKKNGARSREWLESAILRRSDTGWRMALLHSTRIGKP